MVQRQRAHALHLTTVADHIWEYDGYGGYDACDAALSQSQVSARLPGASALFSPLLPRQEYKSLTEKVRTTLSSRSNWLTQEFAFWETAPPHTSASPNPLYELRTYHLKPGMLLEWEANWYVAACLGLFTNCL